MTHKEKVQLANSLPRSRDDIEWKRGKFDTDAWKARRKMIKDRVARKQEAAHQRSLERKKAALLKASLDV